MPARGRIRFMPHCSFHELADKRQTGTWLIDTYSFEVLLFIACYEWKTNSLGWSGNMSTRHGLCMRPWILSACRHPGCNLVEIKLSAFRKRKTYVTSHLIDLISCLEKAWFVQIKIHTAKVYVKQYIKTAASPSSFILVHKNISSIFLQDHYISASM